jgi:hypothetical protein
VNLTPEQQATLEKPVVPVVYFVQFDFASGVLRLSNFNQTFTWGGFEWIGLGALSGVTQVQESDNLDSSPLNFTLNVADMDVLALAIGDVEEYRGRPAKMWMCPLTPNYEMIDDPVLCWSGIMDMMSIGTSNENGQIVLKCETSLYGLRRRPSLRINAVQQKKRYPTDTGLDYLNDMIGNPAVWLTANFQRAP